MVWKIRWSHKKKGSTPNKTYDQVKSTFDSNQNESHQGTITRFLQTMNEADESNFELLHGFGVNGIHREKMPVKELLQRSLWNHFSPSLKPWFTICASSRLWYVEIRSTLYRRRILKTSTSWLSSFKVSVKKTFKTQKLSLIAFISKSR